MVAKMEIILFNTQHMVFTSSPNNSPAHSRISKNGHELILP